MLCIAKIVYCNIRYADSIFNNNCISEIFYAIIILCIVMESRNCLLVKNSCLFFLESNTYTVIENETAVTATAVSRFD